jgi:hypothetical protein
MELMEFIYGGSLSPFVSPATPVITLVGVAAAAAPPTPFS